MQLVVRELLIKILLGTWGILTLAFLVYLMIDYTKTDIASMYSETAGYLGNGFANVSKMQFRQDYEEMLVGERLNESGSIINGVGQGVSLNQYYSSGKLDASSSKVYSSLDSSVLFKNKASVMSIVYDALMESYGDVNLAVGVMANVYAEGSFGIVEYKYSKNHTPPWDATRWSGTSSGIYKIQNKGDIEYLKSLGSNCSVGVGMIQWSFGRRVNLCNKYLGYLADEQSLPFEPYANGILTDEFLMYVEVQCMLEELSSTSYSSVVQACLNASSVEECADIICRKYEAPDNVDEKSAMRQSIASDLAKLLTGGH